MKTTARTKFTCTLCCQSGTAWSLLLSLRYLAVLQPSIRLY